MEKSLSDEKLVQLHYLIRKNKHNILLDKEL